MSTRDNLEITGTDAPHLTIDNGVEIVVTQAFGPTGDSLVGVEDVKFDGHPAVTLLVEANGERGLVHLSPIHGDDRKVSFTDIPVGTKCTLFCPVSKQPLQQLEYGKEGDVRYFAIYLTPKLSKGALVMLSDVWGHYHSRIIDDFELISTWAAEHDELD